MNTTKHITSFFTLLLCLLCTAFTEPNPFIEKKWVIKEVLIDASFEAGLQSETIYAQTDLEKGRTLLFFWMMTDKWLNEKNYHATRYLTFGNQTAFENNFTLTVVSSDGETDKSRGTYRLTGNKLEILCKDIGKASVGLWYALADVEKLTADTLIVSKTINGKKLQMVLTAV